MARRKRAAERVLKAELTHHLGYPEDGKRGPDGNASNGFPPKSLLTESGAIALEIPRDRDGSFTPQFVPKGARRLPSFDEMMLMLYARGLSTRELQAFLVERYQIPVSPDLISTITSELLAEVETGQQRPLEATYVAVAFDALRVKICDEGVVQNKAVYLALGVQRDGTKGGAQLLDRADRGRRLLASRVSRAAGPRRHRRPHRADRWPDGLPDALQTVFPHTVIHQCVVHLVRQSLHHVSWTDRTVVAPALREIYQASTEAAARLAWQRFAASPLK